MENSILTSTKKLLGIDVSYTAFDLDILMHINSAFATLNQLGIGPEDGLEIVDDTTLWTALIGADKLLNSVKTYVYLKVRQVFDPPQNSFAVKAMEDQILQLEWRINAYRESYAWSSPTNDPPSETVLDGGEP